LRRLRLATVDATAPKSARRTWARSPVSRATTGTRTRTTATATSNLPSSGVSTSARGVCNRGASMVNQRVIAIADAFDELHALVVSEPTLAPFVASTEELCAVGQRARAGDSVELTVPSDTKARIPTRELAERVVAI